MPHSNAGNGLLQEASAEQDQNAVHSAAVALVQALQLHPAACAPSAAAAALVAASLSQCASDAILELSSAVTPQLQQRDVLSDMMLVASSNSIAMACL